MARLLSISSVISCHGRHAILGLIEPENMPFDPPSPKIQMSHDMKLIASPIAEIWPFEIRHITRGAFETPILGEWEVILELCRFPIGSISDHSAAICHRMSATLKSTGGGSLWFKVLGCSIWNRFVMLGSADGEHPQAN